MEISVYENFEFVSSYKHISVPIARPVPVEERQRERERERLLYRSRNAIHTHTHTTTILSGVRILEADVVSLVFHNGLDGQRHHSSHCVPEEEKKKKYARNE